MPSPGELSDTPSGPRFSSCQVCSSPIPCFFESLQMKSGPRAKVQQLGTLDQSAHKKTALIKNFSGHLEPWGLLLNH